MGKPKPIGNWHVTRCHQLIGNQSCSCWLQICTHLCFIPPVAGCFKGILTGSFHWGSYGGGWWGAVGGASISEEHSDQLGSDKINIFLVSHLNEPTFLTSITVSEHVPPPPPRPPPPPPPPLLCLCVYRYSSSLPFIFQHSLQIPSGASQILLGFISKLWKSFGANWLTGPLLTLMTCWWDARFSFSNWNVHLICQLYELFTQEHDMENS